MYITDDNKIAKMYLGDLYVPDFMNDADYDLHVFNIESKEDLEYFKEHYKEENDTELYIYTSEKTSFPIQIVIIDGSDFCYTMTYEDYNYVVDRMARSTLAINSKINHADNS